MTVDTISRLPDSGHYTYIGLMTVDTIIYKSHDSGYYTYRSFMTLNTIFYYKTFEQCHNLKIMFTKYIKCLPGRMNMQQHFIVKMDR